MNACEHLLREVVPLLAQEQFHAAADLLSRTIRMNDDWRNLTHEAGSHRLLGYVAHLASLQPDLPSLARDESRRILSAIQLRFAHQRAELEDLVQLLDGLHVQILKGIPLSLAIHPIPHLRPAGDIDLLIAPRDLEEALSRISALVVCPSFPSPFPGWLRERPEALQLDEIVVNRGATIIEIHTHLISFKLPHRLEQRELFASAASDIPVLTPELAWLHMLINHHMHRFSGELGRFLDLALWENRHPLPLSALERDIERWEIGYLVFPPLSRLANLFPDLPSVQHFKTKLASISDANRRESVTPWYWIRQSPRPLQTLRRNLLLTREMAALRYKRNPSDWRLWWSRLCRPIELAWRHRGALSRELLS